MTTPLIALIVIPGALLALLALITIGRYGEDPASRIGESTRQRELMGRAFELRGEVVPEFWPYVTNAAATPADDAVAEAAAVS